MYFLWILAIYGVTLTRCFNLTYALAASAGYPNSQVGAKGPHHDIRGDHVGQPRRYAHHSIEPRLPPRHGPHSRYPARPSNIITPADLTPSPAVYPAQPYTTFVCYMVAERLSSVPSEITPAELFRSADGGLTWDRIDLGEPYFNVRRGAEDNAETSFVTAPPPRNQRQTEGRVRLTRTFPESSIFVRLTDAMGVNKVLAFNDNLKEYELAFTIDDPAYPSASELTMRKVAKWGLDILDPDTTTFSWTIAGSPPHFVEEVTYSDVGNIVSSTTTAVDRSYATVGTVSTNPTANSSPSAQTPFVNSPMTASASAGVPVDPPATLFNQKSGGPSRPIPTQSLVLLELNYAIGSGPSRLSNDINYIWQAFNSRIYRVVLDGAVPNLTFNETLIEIANRSVDRNVAVTPNGYSVNFCGSGGVVFLAGLNNDVGEPSRHLFVPSIGEGCIQSAFLGRPNLLAVTRDGGTILRFALQAYRTDRENTLSPIVNLEQDFSARGLSVRKLDCINYEE